MIPPKQGAFERAPRPLMGWAAVVLMLMILPFIAVVLWSVAQGFLRTAARGQGVPDMTGGLAMLLPAMATAWACIAQWMHTRSMERRTEMGVGDAPPPFGQPSAPTGPLPPSPDGAPRAGDSV